MYKSKEERTRRGEGRQYNLCYLKLFEKFCIRVEDTGHKWIYFRRCMHILRWHLFSKKKKRKSILPFFTVFPYLQIEQTLRENILAYKKIFW